MVESSGFQVGPDEPLHYEAQVGRFMAPFVDALVAATVRSGEAVLDVACGTGFATRAAAAVAGPGARVEGADLNPAMVTVARTVPDDSGAHLGWWEASALDLPFGDNEFDTVICQQGLQFFPDPVAGVREMTRVAGRGARIGVTVWSPSEQSPFLDRETAMLERYGGGAQAEYSTTESQLREWFSRAGVEVAVELVVVEVDLPPVLEYVPEHLKALPWSAGFLALSDEVQAAGLAELEAELADYRTSDGLRVPFSTYLATATI